MKAQTSTPLSDEIFAISVDDRWLLFSPRAWAIALVNRAAVEAVARYARAGSAKAPSEIRQLWELMSALPSPPSDVSEAAKLVVIPTRGCNMRCVYCDFAAGRSPSKTLDPRLACLLFEHFAASTPKRSPQVLGVHFFGGEPLLARECMETIVHYVRAACARRKAVPWFEVTTNGMFDSTAVPFLGDYIDNVVVSLDGGPDHHDFSRRTVGGEATYQDVAANIDRLAQFPVELTIRMCVTDRSVGDLERCATELCSKHRFDVLSVEMLTDNAGAASVALCPPDPYRFALGVLQTERVASAFGVRLAHGPSELAGPRETSCPLGRRTLMLNPDGRLSACYLKAERWAAHGMDLFVGRVERGSGVAIEQDKLDATAALVRTKPRCQRCFCRYTCAGGCHVDQTPPGCSPTYDDRCRAIRMLTAGRLLGRLMGQDAAIAFAERESSLRRVADAVDDRLTAAALCTREEPS